ncbi:MAG TPA: hypothetical protein VEQ11_20330 [Chloroflexota bacterium]|nr:hypothetical protein [Chloroflexota bacterium]
MISVWRPWRALQLIDRLEFDLDLPPTPRSLERLDAWFDRLTEGQRIGVVLFAMLFLAAGSMYCLGLGSTVLVNRTEAALALPLPAETVAEATLEPTWTPLPSATPTYPPPPFLSLPRTGTLPTPVPPPPVTPLPQLPRPLAPAVEVPQRPRIVATPEPTTPPNRVAVTPTRSGTAAPSGLPPQTPSATQPAGVPKPTTAAPAVAPTATLPQSKPTAPPLFNPPTVPPARATTTLPTAVPKTQTR